MKKYILASEREHYEGTDSYYPNNSKIKISKDLKINKNMKPYLPKLVPHQLNSILLHVVSIISPNQFDPIIYLNNC